MKFSYNILISLIKPAPTYNGIYVYNDQIGTLLIDSPAIREILKFQLYRYGLGYAKKINHF